MHHSKNIIEEGTLYPVIVTKLLARGIIVQLDDTGSTEFIHISRISNQFVSNIADFVSVGESLVAKGVKGKDGMTELSLIHLNLNHQNLKQTKVTDAASRDKRLNEMIAAAELSMYDKIGRVQTKTERKHRKRTKRNYN